ncbi:monodechloroaminopyrrolnitrin synthase PrnB family protein [Kitasatospora viridis]|uniref:Uncharacterized protein DUF1864 n=1 Tax=Kitasatospora viridis TaxID=281105 RepID=A0A561UPP3_9ACTN|nr:monodechloroaminopyrrolnitrin synthase PrnB family protein [Kitasatospora viridis]TWG01311.1 uncharacterized protein DUF1864 [Kitasatospora viridis]
MGALRLTDGFCAEVAAADPLRADRLLAELPALNARADPRPLGELLAALAGAADRAPLESAAERLAAMRDMGMTLGSLKRHGVEPLSAVPAAGPVLRRLGARAEMVPRDTVLHYGAWNPRGDRQRMYLGAPEEDVLIQSVRLGAVAVERAALGLAELDGADPGTPEYFRVLRQAVRDFEVLPEQIGVVAGKVAPAGFFMARLRPYFEDVRVGDRSYYGPAAAHVPLHLVDQLLWSSDRVDPAYAELTREMLDYGLPEWSRLHHEREGAESVVTRVVRALLAAGQEASPQLLLTGRTVAELLRSMVVFRGRHLRLVREAYTVDSPYTTGSAGGAPELVKRVLELTRACERQLVGRADEPMP